MGYERLQEGKFVGSPDQIIHVKSRRDAKGNFIIVYHGFERLLERAATQATTLVYRLFAYLQDSLEYPHGSFVACDVKQLMRRFDLQQSSIYEARKALIDVDLMRKYSGKVKEDDPLYKKLYRLRLVELNPHFVFAGEAKQHNAALLRWDKETLQQSDLITDALTRAIEEQSALEALDMEYQQFRQRYIAATGHAPEKEV